MDDDALLQEVYAKATAHRRRTMRTRAAGGALVLAAVVVAAALLVRAEKPDATVVADHDTNPARTIAFNGIAFDLPDGWTVAKPGCGMPADKTVTIGTYGGSCPAPLGQPAPATAVRIYDLFDRQRMFGGGGTPFEWHGTDQGFLVEEQQGGLHGVTLSLPRRNVAIFAQAPDAATARELAVDNAHARAVPDPGVLSGADKVFVESFAGTDGDGLERSATITNREDVDAIARDLRALPTRDRMTPLCTDYSPQAATITVTKGDVDQTFAARFDDCAQTVNGDGNVYRTSDELRADVMRLVPNSGLDGAAPLPAARSCNPGLPGNGIRPSLIFFGCATSRDNLTNIQWTSWTAAKATGTATHNVCLKVPGPCDAADYAHYAVNVILTSPGTVDARFVFRTITLSPADANEPDEATRASCADSHPKTCDSGWGYVPDQQ